MARRRTDTDRTHGRPMEAGALGASRPEVPERLHASLGSALTLAAYDSWVTDRAGNPAWMMEGWQVTSHRDPVKLMQSLIGQKSNPEWKIQAIAPLDPDWIVRKRLEVGLGKLQSNLGNDEAVRAAAEKREAILLAVRNGSTVTKAQDAQGVNAALYSKWRQRFPEWALRMDEARHHRDVTAGAVKAPSERPDFTEFRRHYFGYETYEHHRRIIEAIETTPPGGFTMILVPPEAGKSTLLEDWIGYRTAMDPNYRLLLCTEAGTGESSQAKKMLGAIKERLTDPEADNPDAQYPLHLREFIARYGPFRDPQEDKDKPWNSNYIKVHRASGRRDYTVQCCGWRSKVYGSRCDDLLFDDVQSSDSLNLTANILARMRGTFFSRPGQRGRIIYIGTRVGLGDVPEKLVESGAVDNLVIIPALDSDGRSYCPEMWPEEALAQKRRLVGEAAWWCNYMQDPRQAENPTFDRELLVEARNPAYRIGQVPQDHRVVLGLDPALGGHTALSCTAWTPDQLVVVDIWDQPDLSRNEEIFSMVADYARRYRPSELVVEINSLQRGIARDDRLRKLARDNGFVISEHETTQTKWDQDFGVASMAGSFIRREIVFPDETDFCRKRLEDLVNQMEQWRPNVPARLLRQDMLMSLWFPWRRWMEYRDSSRVDEEMWRMAGTPWSQESGGAPWQSQVGGDVVSIFGAAG